MDDLLLQCGALVAVDRARHEANMRGQPTHTSVHQDLLAPEVCVKDKPLPPNARLQLRRQRGTYEGTTVAPKARRELRRHDGSHEGTTGATMARRERRRQNGRQHGTTGATKTTRETCSHQGSYDDMT